MTDDTRPTGETPWGEEIDWDEDDEAAAEEAWEQARERERKRQARQDRPPRPPAPRPRR